jgi:hypothetical protein
MKDKSQMLSSADFPKMKEREFPKVKEYVQPRMEKYERFLQERRKYDSD